MQFIAYHTQQMIEAWQGKAVAGAASGVGRSRMERAAQKWAAFCVGEGRDARTGGGGCGEGVKIEGQNRSAPRFLVRTTCKPLKYNKVPKD